MVCVAFPRRFHCRSHGSNARVVLHVARAGNGVASQTRIQKLFVHGFVDGGKRVDTIGADALRWFLVSSPVLKGGNLGVDKEGKEIAKASRKAMLPLYNAFYFFCLYANAEGIKAKEITSSTDVLDRYILAKLKTLVESMHESYETYDIGKACADAAEFLDILNNWYIRRSRVRFWDGTDTAAFDTLYTVLVTLSKAMAPIMPMLTEYVYRSLTNEESVHLADYPNVDALKSEEGLIASMDLVRSISSTAKAIREEHKLRNRLPLSSVTVAGEKATSLNDFADLIKDEVNVKEVKLSADVASIADTFLYLKTPLIGKRLGKFMGAIMGASKTGDWSLNPDGSLFIAGQTLTADEFELRLVLKEGLQGQALPDNTAVVQLDTVVHPELEREGIARDFVRMIQQARKEAGLDVSDRISLGTTCSTALIKEALDEHEAYIMDQVLATTRAELSDIETDAFVRTDELGDGSITFAVKKATN